MGRPPTNTNSTHTLRFRSDASQMKRGFDQIDKEMADVITQFDRLNAANQRLAANSKGPNSWSNQFTTGANRAGKSVNKFGMVSQQAGFQLQDFIVQVQGGTSAFVALGQQGSQFLGLFGAGGAIAGAVLALGTAFGRVAYETLLAGEEIEDFGEKTKATLESLREELRLLGLGGISSTEVEFIDNIAAKTAILEEETRKLEARRAQVIAQGEDSEKFWAREQERVDEAAEAVAKAKDEYREFRDIRQRLAQDDEDILGSTEGLEAAQKALDEWNEQRKEALKHEKEMKRRAEAVKQSFENMERLMISMKTLAGLVGDELWDWGKAAAEAGKEIAEAAQQAQTNRIMQGYALYGFLRSRAPTDPVVHDTPSRGGGGSREETADELMRRLEQELRLERELLYVTQDRRDIERMIGEDREKLTEQQLQQLEDIQRANREVSESMNRAQEALDFVGDTLSDGFMDMIDGTKSVEDAFADMARNIINHLFEVFVLQQLIGSFSVASGTGSGLMGLIGGLFFEKGGVMSGGNVTPFAKGGVVTQETIFPMTGGNVGLMGEAGPEAIMPLERGKGGKLGVAGPAIEINNYTGQDVSVDRSADVIRIAVGQAREAVQQDFTRSMQTGQGGYARGIEQGYTSRRKL